MPHKTVLVFAPHPDDEVLGVGGTMFRRVLEGACVTVCIATADANMEQRRAETEKAHRYLGVGKVIHLDLPDLGLDRVSHQKLTGKLRAVIEEVKPTEVYTPSPTDLHTDHRALTEAVLVATRPKYLYSPEFVYAYETLSETGLDFTALKQFSPNVFVDISDTLKEKMTALEMYESQIEEYPCSRSVKAIEGLAVYRGSQARMHYAEAFELLRRFER